MNKDYSYLTNEQFINITIKELSTIENRLLSPYNLTSQNNMLIDDFNRIRKDISNRNINVSIPEYVDYSDTKDIIINKSKLLRRELDNIVIKGTY